MRSRPLSGTRLWNVFCSPSISVPIEFLPCAVLLAAKKSRLRQVCKPHAHASLHYCLGLTVLHSRTPLPRTGGRSRGCKQKRYDAPGIRESAASSPRQSPNGAMTMTVYEMWSGFTHPNPRPKTRRPPAEKMIYINNDFTSASLADGPDLEKVCRQSLKYHFFVVSHLEFFCVSLAVPMTIY